MKPINFFIPSKGRPEVVTAETFKNSPALLEQEYVVFVEPQEVELYRKAGHKNIVDIGATDKGIGYVRNFMVNYAVENNIPWFWMCDDDIKEFTQQIGKKTRPWERNFFTVIEQNAKQLPEHFGIVGLEYNQYVWSATRDCAIGGYCEVCALFKTDIMKKFKYTEKLGLKEDRDMILQLRTNVYQTMRLSKYGFRCPPIGTNKGGLQETYRTTKAKEDCIAMKKKYGDLVDIVEKDGMYDLKIHWRKIK